MARFASASSQYIYNFSPTFVTFPLTIGVWYRPLTSTAINSVIFGLSNPDGSNEAIITQDSSVISFVIQVGSAWNPADVLSGGVTIGKFSYFLARWISATNRRFSVLTDSGAVYHAQSTTSANPTDLNNSSIGAFNSTTGGVTLFCDGDITDCFIANTDVVTGGGQTPRETLWQFAYRGPFSFPHIRHNIVDYQRLREVRELREVKGRRTAVGPRGYEKWQSVPGVGRALSPPTMGGYRFQRNPLGILPV